MNYHFSDPKNTACLVCSHVLDEQHPILFVSHDEDDGMWQFLCGAEEHNSSEGRIIGLGVAVNLDESINALSDMPLGFEAKRQSSTTSWGILKA